MLSYLLLYLSKFCWVFFLIESFQMYCNLGLFIYLFIWGLNGINIHNLLDTNTIIIEKVNINYVSEINFIRYRNYKNLCCNSWMKDFITHCVVLYYLYLIFLLFFLYFLLFQTVQRYLRLSSWHHSKVLFPFFKMIIFSEGFLFIV